MNKILSFSKISIFVIVFWLLCFALLPHILVIISSFLTKGEDNFLELSLSIESYLKLFDPIYFKIFLDSIYLATITTIITLIFAFPFSYIIASSPKRYRFLLLLLLIIPFWTSSLVRTYALIAILKTKGLLNTFLISIGFAIGLITASILSVIIISILSPLFNCSDSLIFYGIVICPLFVMVAKAMINLLIVNRKRFNYNLLVLFPPLSSPTTRSLVHHLGLVGLIDQKRLFLRWIV